MKPRILMVVAMTIALLLSTFAPSGTCQDRDEYTRCRSKCHSEAQYIFNTCMIVYGDSAIHMCAGQAGDYEDSCKAGCPR